MSQRCRRVTSRAPLLDIESDGELVAERMFFTADEAASDTVDTGTVATKRR